jgi:PBP1b-binding outer membrane lipoprotein LpoB
MKRLLAVLFATTSLAGCVMAPVDPNAPNLTPPPL